LKFCFQSNTIIRGRVPSAAPVVPEGTSARSISMPIDSVLCTTAIVSESTGIAEVLIAEATDVIGASVAAGEDVAGETVVEETDVAGATVVEAIDIAGATVAGGKDEAGASVAKVEGFRRLRTGS